ncbi:MAG TPA: Rieske 2Fe-2S domain-containing protein [Roseiflexaceae bacterium]|nr:Rieske 2Fe-2S domain-containing protein [Roseiflexaceae bacterium]
MEALWVRAASRADFETADRKVVSLGDRPVLLVRHEGTFYAVDNRCPHMGFPLEKGSVKDCILTCHWHHARFDLASGGTFDQWADDVRAYPVELRGDEVWVDVSPRQNEHERQLRRLRDGLERNIRLVTAKAAIALLDRGGDPREPFRAALPFGTSYRLAGWGQGLTMLTCFMNMLPHLAEEDRPRALFQGLDAVAVEVDGSAPRFAIAPLPVTSGAADLPTLKRWFRQLVEVRDDEGAERCVVSAVRAGATSAEMADMLFAAITDHRYIQVGHPADFANKALEALDIAGWELAEPTLASLVRGIAMASRMEESNAWRNPVDLVAILEGAFEELPAAVRAGAAARAGGRRWEGRRALAEQLLSDDPQANVAALLGALRAGATPEQAAGAVAYAGALRMARFHTANEFGDWDTVLHTFTFANALHRAIRRVTGAEEDRMTPGATPEERALPLLRGVLDAAMSVYLDRFLNMPPARIPQPRPDGARPEALLAELPALLDRQQQVNQAGELVARYLACAGDGGAQPLLAALGRALAREDRDFHTVQAVEAAFSQHELLRGTPEGDHVLIAAARYLAAHAPTVRAAGQTFQIAERLHRGEAIYED